MEAENEHKTDRTSAQETLAHNAPRDDHVPSEKDPWLVIVIAIGLVIMLTLAVFIAAHHIKSRRRRTKTQFLEEPSEKVDLEKRKSIPANLPLLAEQEREMMIRKSLAGRPSSFPAANGQVLRRLSESDNSQSDATSDEQGETTSLKDDWKAWEARIQSERLSGGIGLEQHPALASHIASLTPQPPRMPSPIRDISQSRLYQPKTMGT
ncbi:hypothetical protein GGS20DRAFT_530498 [Poronia punctata]|nr:hypothetical protein GGS20DRAFT_530498 [Poronia punctata]